MPDYLRTARLLRAKAADPVVPDTERRVLLEKAAELESKYRNRNSPSANDTTVIGRGGYTGPVDDYWTNFLRYADAMRQTEDLLRRQHQWNKPPEDDDITEEQYRYQPEDEDAGYDIYESEEWQ